MFFNQFLVRSIDMITCKFIKKNNTHVSIQLAVIRCIDIINSIQRKCIEKY